MSDVKWGNICERVDTCALTGAAAFYAGIPDTEILVNGPLWCYFYAMRHLEHGVYNIADRMHGSQPDNSAVVFGAEKFIKQAVNRLLNEKHEPALLFVENSCSMSLIGDDITGIVRRMNLPFPVIAMDCGGLIGGFAEGYVKAAILFLQQFAEKTEITKSSINLLGLTDFYYNGKADRIEICRLLKKAGYKINAVFGSGSNIDALKNIAGAELNIVCNEELGLEIAKYLEENYEIPYICAGLPYGIEGTKNWIEKIHNKLESPALEKILNECDETQSEISILNNDINMLWGNLWFENVLVSAPGTAAMCIGSALRSEWADTGNLTIICQNKVPHFYCELADSIYVTNEDSALIHEYYQKINNVLVLGSSSDSSILMRNKADFRYCNIANPGIDEVNFAEIPFVGVRGSRYMLQRLWNIFIAGKLGRNK